MEMIKMFSGLKASAVALTLGAALAVSTGAQAAKVRVAFGDIASVESLHLLAAFERAREQGVDIEVTYLKSEDIAAQAVVGGQADIGVGGPYALVQKVKAPIRMFLQLSTLRFYPAVNAQFYKTWKDLNGQEIAVHSRGSGTEAIMKLMEDRQGIKFSKISYIPGSEVRTGALLQGNVKATIVDSAGRRLLETQAPGKFVILPLEGVNATDEALFANTAFLEKNAADVDKIVEAILDHVARSHREPGGGDRASREIQAAPGSAGRSGDRDRSVFRGACERQGVPAQWRRCRGGEGRLRVLHALRSAHRRAGEPEG